MVTNKDGIESSELSAVTFGIMITGVLTGIAIGILDTISVSVLSDFSIGDIVLLSINGEEKYIVLGTEESVCLFVLDTEKFRSIEPLIGKSDVTLAELGSLVFPVAEIGISEEVVKFTLDEDGMYDSIFSSA